MTDRPPPPFPGQGAAHEQGPLAGTTRARLASTQVAEALGAGTCPPDSAFDQFLPEPMQRLSPRHWSPLAVVTRAAEWFDDYGIRTVLDIGAGAGKFCVAAAMACHSHFTGLEHRGDLVACSRMLARSFGVGSRTHFIHGAIGEAQVPNVDAYYLFNPFEENGMPHADRIDENVELSSERARRDVEATRALLARAPAGTYVLLYNGFCGSLPSSYGQIRVAGELANRLCMWRKMPSRLFGRSAPTRVADSAGAA